MNFKSSLRRLFPVLMQAIIVASLSCYAFCDSPGIDNSSADSIQLIGVAEISGAATDLSKKADELEKGVPANLFGGISALEYDKQKQVYLALPDRGPKDGAFDYHCRFHEMQIDIEPGTDRPVRTKTLATYCFDAGGKAFTGLSSAWEKTEKRHSRLDPEGIRIGADGDFYISDEYGPQILRFDRKGKLTGSVPVPARYLIKNPGPDKATENSKNSSGRQSNRGMEGLAISQSKKSLFGIMQSPLLQDSVRKPNGKPTGSNCRLLKINLDQPNETVEYLYHLDDPSNKLNEILTVDDHTFIVIERDGKPGAKAKCKTLQLISTKNASEIQAIDRLPEQKIPAGVTPVRKQLFVDLLDPRFDLAGDKMPEKIESLCFGPTLKDGRRSLLVVSDNDFSKKHPTLVYVFAVPTSSLRFAEQGRVPTKSASHSK